MGKLELRKMNFFANHGCFEEERIIGNQFIVDFSAVYDMTKAANSDLISDAVDYPQIYNIIKQEMEIPSSLLENVADRILKSVRCNFPSIESASVTIQKLSPPIGGQVGSFAVTLSY
jgi:7,8-dihydroneopterin aldolase/epimerase/oxygenase